MTNKNEILDCTATCAIQDNEIPNVDSLCKEISIEEGSVQNVIIHILRADRSTESLSGFVALH